MHCWPAHPQGKQPQGSAPAGPAHIIKQKALPLQGRVEKWGDFLGAEPQHLGEFISCGTDPSAPRTLFFVPLLSGLQLSQQHGL